MEPVTLGSPEDEDAGDDEFLKAVRSPLVAVSQHLLIRGLRQASVRRIVRCSPSSSPTSPT
jgi:hypothetical protein